MSILHIFWGNHKISGKLIKYNVLSLTDWFLLLRLCFIGYIPVFLVQINANGFVFLLWYLYTYPLLCGLPQRDHAPSLLITWDHNRPYKTAIPCMGLNVKLLYSACLLLLSTALAVISTSRTNKGSLRIHCMALLSRGFPHASTWRYWLPYGANTIASRTTLETDLQKCKKGNSNRFVMIGKP